LFLVDLKAGGVEVRSLTNIDPTHGQAELTFKNCKAEPLGAAGDGWSILTQVLDRAATLLFDHSLFNGHPRFFGYITSSPAPIGALGDLLASAVNQNVGAWRLSPMATEIESQTVRWIAELIGFPVDAGGLLVSGGNAYPVETIEINLDPTEFNANTRVTKLNLRFTATPNSVAPAATFTAGLYPLSTYSGAANSPASVATAGTVIGGSTVAIASPGAVTRVTGTSGDFNCPAAGAYALGVITNGVPTGTSVTSLVAELSMRQV